MYHLKTVIRMIDAHTGMPMEPVMTPVMLKPMREDLLKAIIPNIIPTVHRIRAILYTRNTEPTMLAIRPTIPSTKHTMLIHPLFLRMLAAS